MIELINKEGISALLTLWKLRCLEKTGEKTFDMNCPECKSKQSFPIKELKKSFANILRDNHLNVGFRKHIVELYDKKKEFKLSQKESMHCSEILIILDEELKTKEERGEEDARKRHEQTGDL